MSPPPVSIVVLSWNTKELLAKCLQALRRDPDLRSWEILVVDNASEDGSADMTAQQFPWAKLVRNSENLLYSEGNNIGARAAEGEYLCLLNSDTEVLPGALPMLVRYLAANEDCAVVSPQLLWPDGRIQTACSKICRLKDALAGLPILRRSRWARRARARYTMTDFDHATDMDVEQPPGACMLMRRDEYLAMGGLDPRLSLYFNDVDFCRRLLQNGRRIHYLASAKVYHHHGASTKKRVEEFGHPLWHRNRISYFRKWGGIPSAMVAVACFSAEAIDIGCRILLRPREWAEKPKTLAALCRYVARCLGLARLQR